MKICELTGAALDWAVAKCENRINRYFYLQWEQGHRNYSTDWSQGGPIIEREGIGIWPSEAGDHDGEWCARKIDTYITYSPTPLIAALRCYVASKLGDEVEVPEELK